MYNVLGADGKEYGPVGSDELRKWIVEGRVNARSQLRAEGTTEWRPAGAFPELSLLFVGSAPPMLAQPPAPPVSRSQTSGLAVFSLVLGLLGFCTVGLTALAGLIVGLVALVKISKSQGKLTGRGFAIAGLCLGGFFLLLLPILAALLLPAIGKVKTNTQTVQCVNNLKQLALSVKLYANDNQDTFPEATKWCDAVLPMAGTPQIFQCPAARGDGQRSHYGYNAKLSRLKEDQVNPQTVMIFECSGGWNVSGGPELMVPNHGRVIVVALADGSVQSVPSGRLPSLRWEP